MFFGKENSEPQSILLAHAMVRVQKNVFADILKEENSNNRRKPV
jgi:hypothetical protein